MLKIINTRIRCVQWWWRSNWFLTGWISDRLDLDLDGLDSRRVDGLDVVIFGRSSQSLVKFCKILIKLGNPGIFTKFSIKKIYKIDKIFRKFTKFRTKLSKFSKSQRFTNVYWRIFPKFTENSRIWEEGVITNQTPRSNRKKGNFIQQMQNKKLIFFI